MDLLPDGVFYPNAKMIGDLDRGMSDAVEKAGTSVVLMARRNAINANLVFNRRGQHRFSLHSSPNTAGYSLNLPDVGDARKRTIGLSFTLASVQPEAGSG